VFILSNNIEKYFLPFEEILRFSSKLVKMKKLKSNNTLLQEAERLSRKQQKEIRGGYGTGGTGTGTGGPCYTAYCYNKSNVVVATVNTYPSACTDGTFTIACENAVSPNGSEIWWQGCCGS
jgi:hypothetical protein